MLKSKLPFFGDSRLFLLSDRILVWMFAIGLSATNFAQARSSTDVSDSVPILHNSGAAYLMVESGRLEIEIFRRDRSSRVSRWDTSREMTVRLFDPARELVATEIVPEPTGKANASDWSSTTTQTIDLPAQFSGVYLLLVTMKRDSYLESVRWGLKTNAQHYLFDAGSGHRDAARQETIAFLASEEPAVIAFRPRSSIFSLSATELSGWERGQVVVSEGRQENYSEVTKKRLTSNRFHSVVNREGNGLVNLQLPVSSGRVVIEGVTLPPESGEDWMPLWAPDASVWFDLEASHWMMRPRYQVKMRQESATLQFLHRGEESVEGQLQILDLGQDGWVTREPLRVELSPGEEFVQTIKSPAQGMERTRLRFLVEDFPPAEALVDWEVPGATNNLTTPLELKPFRHSRLSFPSDDEVSKADVYFSQSGQAWFAGEAGLYTRENGNWVEVVGQSAGYGVPSTERLFADTAGRVYALFRQGRAHFLLATQYPEGVISALQLPESVRGTVVIETNTSPTRGIHPPIVLGYERRRVGPRDPGMIWGVDHRLTALVPVWREGRLELGETQVFSEHCIGFSDHSGRSAPVASSGDRSFIVYGETSPPERNDPGVPTYVTVIDRNASDSERPERETVRVGYAPPANDIHNVSSVLVDQQGILHVITGAHNDSFYYTRSLVAEDISEWEPVEQVAPGYHQTYVGAVMDQEDRIHLVSRIWRRGPHFPEDPFDTALIHQMKSVGEAWTEPELLITPPLPHYGIYYHRLTVAPSGRIYLAWTHWPTWSSYRNELRGLGPPGNAFGYNHWVWGEVPAAWNWVTGWEDSAK